MYTVSMRNKVSSIVAFVSIGLYTVAIGIGAVRIVAGMNERRVIAQREFYDLADTASSAGTLGFMEEPFKNALRDAVSSSRTLQAVIVTGPFGAEFTYERNGEGIIGWEGDTPRFRRRFGLSRNPHFSPLRINDVRNATIQAVSAIIDYNAFSHILLQSLYMVLGATVLSVTTLIICHIRAKKTALVSNKMMETYPPEQAQAKPPEQDGETRIKEKLDAELGICAITDKDLALILLDLGPAAASNSGLARRIADRAGQFFTFQASIHERSARGLAFILSGENLENAFSGARQFHDLIPREFPELSPHADEIRFGLSSRNGRLVRADRLFLEADRALDKAGFEPKSPIIAFKSDPEKYRAFAQSGEKTGT